MHRPRAPLSLSGPVPSPSAPLSLSARVPCPSLAPTSSLLSISVHRYRSLHRSPPCPFRTPVHRSAVPCTVIALRSPACFPVHRYRSLSRPLPAPSLHPCTVPVHRYRSLPRPPSRAPVHRPRPNTCATSPCTVIALSPGALPAPCRGAVHRPRTPLSLSAPAPSLPLPYTRAPSPCTVIALCPGPLPLPVPYPTPVHRYRSLPRFPPCTFAWSCAPSACTVIALSAPGPLPALPRPVHRSLPRCPPCPVRTPVPVRRYRSLFRSLPAPSRGAVRRPRAPLSLSVSVPSLHLPVHPCTVPVTVTALPYRSLPRPPCTLPRSSVEPCTVPVIALCPVPSLSQTRTPSPCTIFDLCPGPLPAPSRGAVHPPLNRRAPVHRPRAPLSLSAPAPSVHPCTVFVHRYRSPSLHLPVHPCTVPVHRYRSLPAPSLPLP